MQANKLICCIRPLSHCGLPWHRFLTNGGPDGSQCLPCAALPCPAAPHLALSGIALRILMTALSTLGRVFHSTCPTPLPHLPFSVPFTSSPAWACLVFVGLPYIGQLFLHLALSVWFALLCFALVVFFPWVCVCACFCNCFVFVCSSPPLFGYLMPAKGAAAATAEGGKATHHKCDFCSPLCLHMPDNVIRHSPPLSTPLPPPYRLTVFEVVVRFGFWFQWQLNWPPWENRLKQSISKMRKTRSEATATTTSATPWAGLERAEGGGGGRDARAGKGSRRSRAIGHARGGFSLSFALHINYLLLAIFQKR